MGTRPGDMLAHYRLDEKLGEGGMGVVFKAHDTRLHRSVAIKILPAELVVDRERRLRFQREAQTAAALNHPNIATIHQVDASGDTDFIVMEFVEGRTLRELIRERPMGLKDWLRTALSLAEGLAHAHRQGVVHRDLKPENVMVSPDGRVRILDFGLARLMEPPSPEHASRPLHDDLETISRELTLSGKVFGTIPYMSPEQVRGERADHRSDLFSLGTVLYEMASGRSPFKAKTEIETLHAILNIEPPPLSEVAPGFPAEADRMVRKAMEKEPDRRHQDAADLAADLKNLQRDIETGRSTIASRPGTSRATVLPPAGHRPGRPLVIAVSSVLVLAAAVLGWRALRSPKTPPPPRAPQAAGGAASDHSLAVMYFENVSDPEDTERLGQMITSLLITDLSESRELRVMSRQRLFDTLRLLGKADAKVIDASVASDVALKAGVNWILTGSILQTEPTLVLTANVSDAKSGNIVASQQVSANAGESIFAAVDRLSAEVKNDLAPGVAAAAEADRPVEDVTTSSPEAYREYLEGLDLSYKLYTPEARRHFQRAAELDSTFAMAHYWLANTTRGTERSAALALAVRHADRASERERGLIRALELEVGGKRDEGIRELRALTERYPDDKYPYQRLAQIYNTANDPRNAIEVLTRIIEIDPLDKLAYNNLAYAYDEIGEFDRSIAAIDKYISLAPDEANPYDTRGDLYSRHGRVVEAMESYRQALKRNPDFIMSRGKLAALHLYRREYADAESLYHTLAAGDARAGRSAARTGLALIPAFQGNLREAISRLDQGIGSDALEKEEGGQLGKLALQVSLYLVRRDFQPARETADRFVEAYKRLDPDNAGQAKALLVWVLVASGDVAGADREFKVLEKSIDPKNLEQYQLSQITASSLLAARGDSTAALAALRGVGGDEASSATSYWAGFAYLKLGHLEEAVAQLERCLNTYDENRFAIGPGLVLAHYFLGTAYEQTGWKQKAAGEYREFLAYWGDGDPDIVEVQDAKARLAKLAPGT